MQDAVGQQLILHNNEQCDLCSESSIATAVKHRRLWWDVHVDSMHIT